MLKNEEKNLIKDTLTVGVFTIYDTVLKQYDAPICIPDNRILDYFKLVVNDVNSKYFMHESDYIIYRIGEFNNEYGSLIQLDDIVSFGSLDRFIDVEKRRLQTIVQVLNYLPCGYFKMPDEMKRDIQDKIDSAIMEYVANYVIPDLDVGKFDTEKVKDIYKHYDDMIKYRDAYIEDI